MIALPPLKASPPAAARPRVTIALVLDSITAQRLARGMFRQFRPDKSFRFLDIYRPLPDLIARLTAWRPAVIVTRWAPGITEAIARLQVPTVLIGGHEARSRTVCVGVDNVQVGELAARHLVDRGLRNFAFVGKPFPFSELRQRGFERALAAAGCRSAGAHVESGQSLEHQIEDWLHADATLEAWLKELPKPIGIFAAHDTGGWHVLQACAAAGLRVPDDVAVVAANNDELTCGLAHPPLSSVSIPWDKIGGEVALAVARLVARRGRGSVGPAVIRVPPDGVTVRQSSNLMAVAQPMLALALAFIQQHAFSPITVKDLLQQVPLSRRKLEQLFQAHLKRSPKAEITRVRIEHAKNLLARTDHFIPRVAESCGYVYTARFSTAFKQLAGLTPTAYRNQFRCKKGVA
ncbi:MAG TPA: substrate-binding domain-containing protein [Opitutaceae bacterium]|nr:substrate-binding domain-containing protein [Opitutaceae bacterium]